MLLPFCGVPDPDETELPVPKRQPAKQDKSPESSDRSLSSSDFSVEDKAVDRDDKQAEPETVPRYIIPQRREGWQDIYSRDGDDYDSYRPPQQPRWGTRRTKPPDRLGSKLADKRICDTGQAKGYGICMILCGKIEVL